MVILPEELDKDIISFDNREGKSEVRKLGHFGGSTKFLNACFTLIVFDIRSGKISCSLVSKERGTSSESSTPTIASDVINSLNEEMSLLASKNIVSAGCFNVWKGLFK